jgi:hypothetical protein
LSSDAGHRFVSDQGQTPHTGVHRTRCAARWRCRVHRTSATTRW